MTILDLNTGEVTILDTFFTTYTVINFTLDTETVKSRLKVTIDAMITLQGANTSSITISKMSPYVDKLYSINYLGTYFVSRATIAETENEAINIQTLYSEGSAASGALFSFVFLTEDGGVDFNRSALLALDRNTSLNHTPPFNLHPGRYRVYVYDIEQDGTLSNGVYIPSSKK